MEANASAWSNRTRRQIAEEILADAERLDAEEDNLFGDAPNRFLQAFNAQAAVSDDQVVVAAEMTNAANDSTMFKSLVEAADKNLSEAGHAEAVSSYLADAGYWSTANATHPVDGEVLIKPIPATNGIVDPDDPRVVERDGVMPRHEAGEITLRAASREMGVSETWARKLRADRQNDGPDPAQLRKTMLDRLASDDGHRLYAKRKVTVEPVFGNIEANLRFRRFFRRSMPAALSEWRLICSVHNLLKLRTARLAVVS